MSRKDPPLFRFSICFRRGGQNPPPRGQGGRGLREGGSASGTGLAGLAGGAAGAGHASAGHAQNRRPCDPDRQPAALGSGWASASHSDAPQSGGGGHRPRPGLATHHADAAAPRAPPRSPHNVVLRLHRCLRLRRRGHCGLQVRVEGAGRGGRGRVRGRWHGAGQGGRGCALASPSPVRPNHPLPPVRPNHPLPPLPPRCCCKSCGAKCACADCQCSKAACCPGGAECCKDGCGCAEGCTCKAGCAAAK